MCLSEDLYSFKRKNCLQKNYYIDCCEIIQLFSEWNDLSVIFQLVTSFLDMTLENYIQEDLSNVTFTVLEGEVVYEIEDTVLLQSIGVKLKKGDSIPIEVGFFHKIHTISQNPSCYMYTYTRGSVIEENIGKTNAKFYSPFPLLEDTEVRYREFLRMWKHIVSAMSHLLFSTPYQIRTEITK